VTEAVPPKQYGRIDDVRAIQRPTVTAAGVANVADCAGRTPSLKGRAARASSPNAGDIARALIDDLAGLVGEELQRVTREMVVPITGERADVAAIGQVTWLFEIKSGRDSLRRLERQVDAFARVGDRCVLVTAQRHLPNAAAMLPSWWGILEVEEEEGVPSMRWHRPAAPNPAPDRRTLLLMLRKEEALSALSALDGDVTLARRRMALLADLDRRLDDTAVRACVRGALARRA
jgi:hypothetical protein